METGKNVTVIPARKITADNTDQYHQLRVAAYCRVSTEMEEQQNSFKVQVEYYTNLINSKKEWTLAGIFADEGISGTQTKKRVEFNRMIRQCKQKKIDLILTKSISRFARNTVDCLEYVRQLKELGIGVLFEKENINTLTMSSEFMISLYSSFAQAESESISKNISLGNQMAFRQGKVRYQYKNWLGYRKGADGKPEIVPEEAEIIKMIYSLFLDGASLKGIADKMNQDTIRTPSGNGAWFSPLVKRILTNEKYIGDALLQKTYTVDCITHKKVINHGEKPKYLVTDCHPAIIDRDTFNLVQQEFARRTSKRKATTTGVSAHGKYSSKHALTELMVCGECGTPYRRAVWHQRGVEYRVWRCVNRLEHGVRFCHNSPTIREEPLHRAIVQAINDFYGSSQDISNLLKSSVESTLANIGQTETQRIEHRLKEIDNARNDMIGMIASGTCNEDDLDEEFAKLFAEEQKLDEKLTVLKAQYNNTSGNRMKIKHALAEIDNTTFELDHYDNVLVRKLIECVKVVSKTEILITFKGGFEVSAEVEKK